MRQLSFAFLRSGRHATELPASVAVPAQPVTLCKVDPSRNMARFYSLEVERDLFRARGSRQEMGQAWNSRQNQA
jgi:hypothetical protein